MRKYYDLLLEKQTDMPVMEEADINLLQTYVEEAKQATASDRKANQRVRFVEEGIGYLRNISNLFSTGRAVIQGKKDIHAYRKVKEETYQFLKDKCYTWSIATVQNFRRLKMSIRDLEHEMPPSVR